MGDTTKEASNQNQLSPELNTESKLKAEHDALYGKYSNAKNQIYKTAEIAFSANPETINQFDDELKDKIVKEKFGYESYEEALAVLGKDFYKQKKEEGNSEASLEATVAELVKDKKISDFRQKNKEEDDAIELYIAKNPSIFEGIEQPKELIKKELKKLADGLSMSEKLDDASSLVRIKNSKSGVTFANTTSGGNININDKSKPSRNPALAKLFGNKI